MAAGDSNLYIYNYHGKITNLNTDSILYKDRNFSCSFEIEPDNTFIPPSGASVTNNVSTTFTIKIEYDNGSIIRLLRTYTTSIQCTRYTRTSSTDCPNSGTNITINEYDFIPNSNTQVNITDIDTTSITEIDSNGTIKVSLKTNSSSGGCEHTSPTPISYNESAENTVTTNPFISSYNYKISGDSDIITCFNTTNVNNVNSVLEITTTDTGYLRTGAYLYNTNDTSTAIDTLMPLTDIFIDGNTNISRNFSYNNLNIGNTYGLKWRILNDADPNNDIYIGISQKVTIPPSISIDTPTISQGNDQATISWGSYHNENPSDYGYSFNHYYNINNGEWVNTTSNDITFSGISAIISAKNTFEREYCDTVESQSASLTVYKTPKIESITQVECGEIATINTEWATKVTINSDEYSVNSTNGYETGTVTFTPSAGNTYTITPSNDGLDGNNLQYTCSSCSNVSNLNITESTSQPGRINISWTTVSGANEYKIYRKDGNSTYQYIGSTSSSSYNDNPPLPRTTPNELNESNFTYTCSNSLLDTHVNTSITEDQIEYEYKITTICNSSESNGTTGSITLTSEARTTGIAYKKCHISDYHSNNINLHDATIEYDSNGIFVLQDNYVYGVASYVRDQYNHRSYGTWIYFSNNENGEKLCGNVGEFRAVINSVTLQSNGDLNINFSLEFRNKNGNWVNVYGHENDFPLGLGAGSSFLFTHVRFYVKETNGNYTEIYQTNNVDGNYVPLFAHDYTITIDADNINSYNGYDIYTGVAGYNKYQTTTCQKSYGPIFTSAKIPSDLEINITTSFNGNSTQTEWCEDSISSQSPGNFRVNGTINGADTNLTNGTEYRLALIARNNDTNSTHYGDILTIIPSDDSAEYNNGISLSIDKTYERSAKEPYLFRIDTAIVDMNNNVIHTISAKNYKFYQKINPQITTAIYDISTEKVQVSGRMIGTSDPFVLVSSYNTRVYVSYDGTSFTEINSTQFNYNEPSEDEFTLTINNIHSAPNSVKVQYDFSAPCNGYEYHISTVSNSSEPTISTISLNKNKLCPSEILDITTVVSNPQNNYTIEYDVLETNSSSTSLYHTTQAVITGTSSYNHSINLSTITAMQTTNPTNNNQYILRVIITN